jgi:hypothetical protein
LLALGDSVSDDQFGERVVVKSCGVPRDHTFAVAQNGYAIRDLEDLGQPMRHVQDRDSLGADVVEEREQVLDIALRQRRRRLVEH